MGILLSEVQNSTSVGPKPPWTLSNMKAKKGPKLVYICRGSPIGVPLTEVSNRRSATSGVLFSSLQSERTFTQNDQVCAGPSACLSKGVGRGC